MTAAGLGRRDESVALLEKQERLNREKIRLIICDQNQRGMAGIPVSWKPWTWYGV